LQEQAFDEAVVEEFALEEEEEQQVRRQPGFVVVRKASLFEYEEQVEKGRCYGSLIAKARVRLQIEREQEEEDEDEDGEQKQEM